MQAWHLFWRTSANDCFCTALAHSLLSRSYHSYHFQIPVWGNLITLFNSQRNADPKLKSIETLRHQSGALSSWSTMITPCCYLSVLLYIHTFFLIITATSVNIFNVCFWFKFKRLQKNLNLISPLSSVLFSFSMFFLSFSVLLHFLLSLLIKGFFKLRID